VSATLAILLLWAAFTATHVGLASARVATGLRARIGEGPFLGLYSLVALACFAPLVRVYSANRHSGPWLWEVPLGPGLRAALYAGISFGLVLAMCAFLRPSPAAMRPGPGEVRGAYRVTRHPFVLGLALVWALHMLPNASTADLAFFGGFAAFSLLAAAHQDARKRAAERALPEAERVYTRFGADSPFLPFTGRATLRGLREIPPLAWALGLAAALLIRALHGSLWPHA
jgi:uncharacterized membrane protein